MAHSMALLTQSSYYSPALDGAIFDGPFKVYFTQSQESLGLSVYFQIQKKLGDLYSRAKELFKTDGFNVFIMIYPSGDSFQTVKGGEELAPGFFEGKVEENLLIGINKDITDEQFEFLYVYLQEKINQAAQVVAASDVNTVQL